MLTPSTGNGNSRQAVGVAAAGRRCHQAESLPILAGISTAGIDAKPRLCGLCTVPDPLDLQRQIT